MTAISAKVCLVTILCHLLFSKQREHKSNQQHGGDEHIVGPEDQKRPQRREHTDQHGQMVAVLLPLIHDDRDEQRRQYKVDPVALERQHTAGRRAERAAEDPVTLVKEGDEKVVVKARVVRCGIAAKQRVGLVRQRKHQIRPPPRRAFVFVDHGDTVKQMARVDHQGGHGRRQKRHAAREQIDRHILHGARVHGTRHHRRQPYRVAPRAQNDAEPEAQPEIAGKDRQGGHQSAADGFDALLLQKHRLP